MSRSTFTAIAAVASFVGGALALLAPRQLGAFYGLQLNEAGVAQEQLLGAAYLGYGMMNWLAKDVRDPAAERAMAIGNSAGWAISLVVAMATIAASNAPTAWSLVATQAFFAAAWAYYAFSESAVTISGRRSGNKEQA